MPAEGQGQGRRINRNLSEALGAFPKCKAGPPWIGGTAGELRNVPLWLSRLSIREATGFQVADRGRERDLHKAWTAEGATAEPAPG